MYQFDNLSMCQPVNLPIGKFVNMSICQFVNLTVCQFDNLLICPSIYQFVNLLAICQFVNGLTCGGLGGTTGRTEKLCRSLYVELGLLIALGASPIAIRMYGWSYMWRAGRDYLSHWELRPSLYVGLA